MVEDQNFELKKLCFRLNKLRAKELKLARARYKVSYLKKIKRALSAPKQPQKLPDGFYKWKGKTVKLKREIAKAELFVLKAQKELLDLRTKARGPVNKSLAKVNAALIFKDGRIIGVHVKSGGDIVKTVSVDQLEELAGEYELTVKLEKLLKV